MAIRKLTPQEMAFYAAQRARAERPAHLARLRRERSSFTIWSVINMLFVVVAWVISGEFFWILWLNITIGAACVASVIHRHLKIRKVQTQLERDQEEGSAAA